MELEQKIVELLDVAQGIAPKVTEGVLLALQVDALSNLIISLVFTVISLFGIYALIKYRANYIAKREKYDALDVNLLTGFCLMWPLLIFLCNLGHLIDLRVWAILINPEIGLALRVL